jgi:stress response protein YsnF
VGGAVRYSRRGILAPAERCDLVDGMAHALPALVLKAGHRISAISSPHDAASMEDGGNVGEDHAETAISLQADLRRRPEVLIAQAAASTSRLSVVQLGAGGKSLARCWWRLEAGHGSTWIAPRGGMTRGSSALRRYRSDDRNTFRFARASSQARRYRGTIHKAADYRGMNKRNAPDHGNGANEEAPSVPVVEEELTVATRQVAKGTVRVEVRTETLQEEVPLTIAEDAVAVTRVPIDRPVDAPPVIRTEGDTTILPILEEVIVVQKQLVLKEEVHVRRESRRKHVRVPVSRRRQRAIIQHPAHKKPTRT